MNFTRGVYEDIEAFYKRCPHLSLRDDLERHVRHGYVFSSPRYLLLGRRVGHGWFIYLAAGRNCLREFLRLMPYYLPYIGWAREAKGREKVRWYQTDRVRRLIERYENIPGLFSSSAGDCFDIPEPSSPRFRRIQRWGFSAETAQTPNASDDY